MRLRKAKSAFERLPALLRWSGRAAPTEASSMSTGWISMPGWRSERRSPAYLPDRPWKDLLHPEDCDSLRALKNSLRKPGIRSRCRRACAGASDGSCRWFLCRAVAVRERKTPVSGGWGCTGIQQQIRKRHAQLRIANEALKQSNADLRASNSPTPPVTICRSRCGWYRLQPAVEGRVRRGALTAMLRPTSILPSMERAECRIC